MTEAGSSGYADFQRIVNWDSPMIREVKGELHKATLTLPRVNCSRYAYLAGKLLAEFNGMYVTFKWWSAQEGGILLGERTLLIFGTLGGGAQIHIPNMGPWLEIVEECRLNEWRETAVLFLTNRPLPVEIIPTKPLFFQYERATVTGPEELAVACNTYFYGPVRLMIQQTEAATQYVSVRSPSGLAETPVLLEKVSGGALVNLFTVYAPFGPCEFLLNMNATKALKIIAQPLLTGSS